MAKSNNLIKICDVSSIRENEGIRIFIENKDIALFKIDNEIFAISNVCPHNNSSILYDGILRSYTITCPYHGWQYDIKTGKCVKGFKDIEFFRTKILDNILYLDLS